MWKFATLDSQVWPEAVLTQFVSSRLMASPTRCTWVWVNSGSWWWTGKPGVLQSMGSQRVGHDWATELNWTETVSGQVTLCASIFLLLVSEVAVASFSKFPANAAILWFRCSWKVECIFFFFSKWKSIFQWAWESILQLFSPQGLQLISCVLWLLTLWLL